MPINDIRDIVRAGSWPLVALAFAGLLACGKKEAPSPTEAPPPAASSGAPEGAQVIRDPALVKAMDDIVQYRMRVEKDPKDTEAMAALGNANLALKRFDHAKDWYERALKVDPNRIETRMDLAIALRFMGKPDDAISELDRVLAKDPKNAGALYNLGVILLEDKHDQQKAIAKWEALMKAHPDYPHATELRQVVESLKNPPPAPPAAGG
jgi:cytochrome c-type biogenesis protein CcmH/NrfG